MAVANAIAIATFWNVNNVLIWLNILSPELDKRGDIY